MAGHSKWANIKHRKGAQDAKRGKLFTKLIREITVAARLGGEDTGANPRLRAAVDAALGANMSKDTINRAIQKGVGGLEGDQLEEIRYEGYGASGIAVMVDCMTDNRNRTVAEVRHAFTKMGGNLGTDGSVAYMFDKKGILILPNDYDEEAVFEVALELGADDVERDTHQTTIVCQESVYVDLKEGLLAQGWDIISGEVTMVAENEVDLTLDDAEKVLRLLDMLEDLDDVQKVYTNANIPEDVLEQLG